MHQPLCQLRTVMMTFDCLNLKSTPRLTILQFQCRHVAWLDLTFLSLARPQCRPGLSTAVSALPHDDSNTTYVFSSPIFGKNSTNQIAQNVAALYPQIKNDDCLYALLESCVNFAFRVIALIGELHVPSAVRTNNTRTVICVM